jgi:hypothetical protein
MPSSQFGAFPHFPNLAKLGSIVHSHRLHRLICGYWQIPEKHQDRGSGGKMTIFQMGHLTNVSIQIHSSIPQYDVYKVSLKKMSGRNPLGGSKLIFFGFCSESGFSCWIFVGFSVVCALQSMQMTLSQPLNIYLCVDKFIPTILHIFIH